VQQHHKIGKKKKTLGWGAIWIRFSHHTLLEFPVLIPKCPDMRTRYSSNPNRHYGYSMLELSFHPGSWFSAHPSGRSSFTVFAAFFRLPEDKLLQSERVHSAIKENRVQLFGAP
jgi:hypothetical protein